MLDQFLRVFIMADGYHRSGAVAVIEGQANQSGPTRCIGWRNACRPEPIHDHIVERPEAGPMVRRNNSNICARDRSAVIVFDRQFKRESSLQ